MTNRHTHTQTRSVIVLVDTEFTSIGCLMNCVTFETLKVVGIVRRRTATHFFCDFTSGLLGANNLKFEYFWQGKMKNLFYVTIESMLTFCLKFLIFFFAPKTPAFTTFLIPQNLYIKQSYLN